MSPIQGPRRQDNLSGIHDEVKVLNDMVKNLLLWLVIAAVLLSVFNNFNMQSATEQVGYSEFIQEIQSLSRRAARDHLQRRLFKD